MINKSKHISIFAIALVTLFITVTANYAVSPDDHETIVRPATVNQKLTNDDGFIQLWNILEPITANGETQNVVRQTVSQQYFDGQLTVIPKDGQKVTVNGSELVWHSADTDKYNINLHYFAKTYGKTPTRALFWVVTTIDCPQEMVDARLAIGSNSASVWWVNGKEVIGIYGNRQTVIDDGVSRRLTLKKGTNVIRGAIINASGATDFCARILDSKGNPVNNLTIKIN